MSVAEYSWEFKVQAWRTDRYYVGSSQPVDRITVVASTEVEAKVEARRMLGPLNSGWYYRFWLIEAKDIRLLDQEGDAS